MAARGHEERRGNRDKPFSRGCAGDVHRIRHDGLLGRLGLGAAIEKVQTLQLGLLAAQAVVEAGGAVALGYHAIFQCVGRGGRTIIVYARTPLEDALQPFRRTDS